MDHLASLIKLKQKLFKNCANYLEEKILRISGSIRDLEEDLTNESKSSAGDKYETGREMINIEIQKLSTQLQQFQKLEVNLEVAKRSFASGIVKLGSLVVASNATYFICIPMGEVNLEDKKVYVIGANSPVAQALIGKAEGDIFKFNAISGTIVSIS